MINVIVNNSGAGYCAKSSLEWKAIGINWSSSRRSLIIVCPFLSVSPDGGLPRGKPVPAHIPIIKDERPANNRIAEFEGKNCIFFNDAVAALYYDGTAKHGKRKTGRRNEMQGKKRFERWYMKYVVKSPVLFCVYLAVFSGAFLIASSVVTLEERRVYEGKIDGEEIEIVCGEALELFDNRVYFYEDRNREVFSFAVKEAAYSNGVMHILLCGAQKEVSGTITVEIVSGEHTLFQRIFGKAGAA